MSVFNRAYRVKAPAMVEPNGVIAPAPARSYADARTDALAASQAVGVEMNDEFSATLSVADLVTLAYATGLKAGEARLAAPDIADAIAGAIATPSGILERLSGESESGHVVRAVQQVVAYGVPR